MHFLCFRQCLSNVGDLLRERGRVDDWISITVILIYPRASRMENDATRNKSELFLIQDIFFLYRSETEYQGKIFVKCILSNHGCELNGPRRFFFRAFRQALQQFRNFRKTSVDVIDQAPLARITGSTGLS